MVPMDHGPVHGSFPLTSMTPWCPFLDGPCMDGPWINGWSVHQYPLGCPSNANEPIARARAWTFWSLLSALGYVVTTVSLNTSDHFLPQNRERLWIMGYRDDLCGQASHADVQEFLKAKTALLAHGNTSISVDDVLLPEHHPTIARTLEHARAAPMMQQQHSAKRVKWQDDNISRLGLDTWLTNRLHVPDDLLEAYPGFKLLNPRQRDCLMTAGVELPTEKPIVANVMSSTQYLSVSNGHFPTITPKGIFFLCNRVRQP